MHPITFQVTRAKDGHYVAAAQGHNITTTSMTFDKLIRNIEEELAVHATHGVKDLPYTLVFSHVLELDQDDEAERPILFPY